MGNESILLREKRQPAMRRKTRRDSCHQALEGRTSALQRLKKLGVTTIVMKRSPAGVTVDAPRPTRT
jgi:hypothetical protein